MARGSSEERTETSREQSVAVGQARKLCKSEDIHAAIASCRGMLPSVRAVLDHLAVHLSKALKE